MTTRLVSEPGENVCVHLPTYPARIERIRVLDQRFRRHERRRTGRARKQRVEALKFGGYTKIGDLHTIRIGQE
jgi:hypothetical protein